MGIDYNHSENLHTQEGPRVAMEKIFPGARPASLLDVGCGTGTWLKAAAEAGVTDLMGVDGVAIPEGSLLFPASRFRHQDLTKPWDLGRRFEAVLCLEVAEHLDEAYAGILIDALVRHADVVIFSAACPHQAGQHHVNCQWPVYWQRLFNARGYSCDDELRWRIWDLEAIEPWYRQNIFVARRAAGPVEDEAAIRSVAHPEMVTSLKGNLSEDVFAVYVDQIVNGRMSPGWYVTLPVRAAWAKIRRKMKLS